MCTLIKNATLSLGVKPVLWILIVVHLSEEAHSSAWHPRDASVSWAVSSLTLFLSMFRSVHISVQHLEVSGREGPHPPGPG